MFHHLTHLSVSLRLPQSYDICLSECLSHPAFQSSYSFTPSWWATKCVCVCVCYFCVWFNCCVTVFPLNCLHSFVPVHVCLQYRKPPNSFHITFQLISYITVCPTHVLDDVTLLTKFYASISTISNTLLNPKPSRCLQLCQSVIRDALNVNSPLWRY